MGERRVAVFQKGGENVITTYHHWGAYTWDALEFALGVSEIINEKREVKEVVEAMIKRDLISSVCEESCKVLGIATKEPDRNSGLCSIIPEEMESFERISIMTLFVNLDDGTVNVAGAFDVADIYNMCYHSDDFFGLEESEYDDFVEKLDEDFIMHEIGNPDQIKKNLEKNGYDMSEKHVIAFLKHMDKLLYETVYCDIDLTKMEYNDIAWLLNQIDMYPDRYIQLTDELLETRGC